MTRTLTITLFLISTTNLAKGKECQAPMSPALTSIYSDSEIRNYVCGSENSCTPQDFKKKLDIQKVKLRTTASTDDGIIVEPTRKGLQYFTAVFHKKACHYRLVFYPDTTLSGLKILSKSKNGFFIIKTSENKSREEWIEITYIYDQSRQLYKEHENTRFIENSTGAQITPCQ